MTDTPVLYGFDGSTYVRTVRMVLADNDIAYDQVPVNVLEGEPHNPEHLERHPFGKVPVMDIDGMRLLETDAIIRYLDETGTGPSLLPETAADRARMTMAMGLINSYGYGALVGVAGYHLFPDFIGGQNDEAKEKAMAASKTLLRLLMEKKGSDPWLAGPSPSLADYLLAPIMAYVAMTPDADDLLSVPGVGAWWEAVQAIPSFGPTAPG
jgi:glutathione S-transferase